MFSIKDDIYWSIIAFSAIKCSIFFVKKIYFLQSLTLT